MTQFQEKCKTSDNYCVCQKKVVSLQRKFEYGQLADKRMHDMIGVCIVTYNEETYIAECIDSALAQKCSEPIRVYVANDCSTDKTAEVCRSYGDKIVFIDREKNLGLVGNTLDITK